MLFYEGLSCPVCHKPFDEKDDIVTCPQCGLPHHRACWQTTGHCQAEHLHNTDQQWSRDAQRKETAPPNDSPVSPPPPPPSDTYYEYKPFRQQNDATHAFTADDRIDDIQAKDYAAIINTKTEYYIPRFRQIAIGGSGGWNWAAFFFGAYWMIYRKMYVGGFLLLLLNLFQTLVTGLAINALNIVSTDQLYYAMYNTFALAATDKTQFFYLLSIWILSAIIMAINILIAVFGNRLYQQHCAKLITKARQRVPDLSAPELAGIGGTSLGVVMISGVLASFIEQLISMLIV